MENNMETHPHTHTDRQTEEQIKVAVTFPTKFHPNFDSFHRLIQIKQLNVRFHRLLLCDSSLVDGDKQQVALIPLH